MGTGTPAGEGPRVFPTSGGTADGGHGPQTSTVWGMGVPNHWGSASNSGDELYLGVYFLPSEHVRTIHSDSSYNELVSGGGAESGPATIKSMVVAACSIYPRNKSMTRRRGGGGGHTGTEES